MARKYHLLAVIELQILESKAFFKLHWWGDLENNKKYHYSKVRISNSRQNYAPRFPVHELEYEIGYG